MKSLIVDDDMYVRTGLGKLIPWETLQFDEVLYADNGASAFNLAIEQQPDLIITDVKMPIMDGVELCKKISEADIETYIIMLSAYDDFEFARAALSYNVKDYILKPLREENLKQLTDKIGELMSQHRRKQQYRRTVFNKDFSNQISNSLHSSDIEGINRLFMKALPEMRLSQAEVKDFCLVLVDLLFDYLKEIGYSADSDVYRKRIDAIDNILDTKTPADITQYTFNLYMELLSTAAKTPEVNLLVNEMCLYIDKHYTNPDLSVAGIANDLHIASGYAGPLFKKHKGIKLQTYINNLRVEQASMLLEDITFKVSEIGQKVGIPDNNHFCKVFKKIKGVSPKEYRNIRLMNNINVTNK